MRAMIPDFHVVPYRSIDGGDVVPRGHLRIDLAPFISPSRDEECRGFATADLVVDLFRPPHRLLHRVKIMRLTRQGLYAKVIAKRLGISPAAVHAARRLTAEMERRGVTDPYEMVTVPPGEGGGPRRHLGPRFQFRPREG